jgi:hypothetical protein
MVTTIITAGDTKATVAATPDAGVYKLVAEQEDAVPDLDAGVLKPSLRKSFSIKDKREIIRSVDTIVATGSSHRKACYQLGVSHVYYSCF